jgi:hypothetical protein
MADLTREAVIEAARRIAAEVGGMLSKTDFERLSRIGDYHLYRLFPDGGWSEIRELAGIERHPLDRDPLTDDMLIREFVRVATDLERIPTWAVFDSKAKISADTIRRRFGGMQGTLKRVMDWLDVHDPKSPLRQHMQTKSRHEIPIPPQPSNQMPVASSDWIKLPGMVFGQPIDFRGLRHAPINEQGVVFLFGMIAYELGFIVESVQTGYPDCEAKRCVNRKTQKWQRVRIEFEFRSSNFDHDPAGCDVIVCWEHDWPECPLEVVELRTIIDRLDA